MSAGGAGEGSSRSQAGLLRTATSLPRARGAAIDRTAASEAGPDPTAPSPAPGAAPADTVPVPAEALDVPAILGPYRVIRALGEGGMGKVYLGHDDKLDRPVALKVLSKDLAADPAFTARFLQEARAIAKVNHPNVVSIYYADQDQGICFFAMECVEGATLEALIHERGPLDVRLALEIVSQAARGLAAAQSRGILHRDIKPSNIILDAGGQVKLLDFGLAKDTRSSTSRTSTGMFLGTPRYMSPEQCRGKKVDCRSDMYSLGVTLYEALAGVPPFDADTPLAVIDMHVHQPPPSVRQARPDVSEAVAALVERMLAKDADGRHPGYAELLADLTVLSQGGPARPPAVTRVQPPPPAAMDARRQQDAMSGLPWMPAQAPSGLGGGHAVGPATLPLADYRGLAGQASGQPAALGPAGVAGPRALGAAGSAAGTASAAVGSTAQLNSVAPQDDRMMLDDLIGSLVTPRDFFAGAGQEPGVVRPVLAAAILSVVTGGWVLSCGGLMPSEPVHLLAAAAALVAATHLLSRMLGGSGALSQTLLIEVAGLPTLALAAATFIPVLWGQRPAAVLAAAALLFHLRTRWAGISVLHALTGWRPALPLALGALIACAYVGQTMADVRQGLAQADASGAQADAQAAASPVPSGAPSASPAASAAPSRAIAGGPAPSRPPEPAAPPPTDQTVPLDAPFAEGVSLDGNPQPPTRRRAPPPPQDLPPPAAAAPGPPPDQGLFGQAQPQPAFERINSQFQQPQQPLEPPPRQPSNAQPQGQNQGPQGPPPPPRQPPGGVQRPFQPQMPPGGGGGFQMPRPNPMPRQGGFRRR